MRPIWRIVSILAFSATSLSAQELESSLIESDQGSSIATLSCTWRITCEGTRLQMRWFVENATCDTPPQCSACWTEAAPDKPLAVLLRGHGYAYRDYDYLQIDLARQGIVSVAVDEVAKYSTSEHHQRVADQTVKILESSCFEENFLDNFSTDQPIDRSRTVLIGHSRGGETSRYLADNLAFDPEFSVRSVIALAPTHNTAAPLFGTETPAYLELYGTEDPDVPPAAAFASHDLAGWNESSTPNAFDLDRAMKLIVGGNHRHFTDLTDIIPAPSEPTAQAQLTAAYVTEFLKPWLFNDWGSYEANIRQGTADPPAPWFNVVYSQFSSSLARRVIDSFSRKSLSPSTMGGAVWTHGMEAAEPRNGAELGKTPHAGSLLRLRPAIHGAFVAWQIPREFSDARAYLQLSLRIGLLDGEGAGIVGLLIDNGGDLSAVDLAAYGGIPEPEPMCVPNGTAQFCQEKVRLGHMRTIRVPLSDLGAHDDVRTIALGFDESAVGKEFIVDNLEFADSLFVWYP